MLCIAKSIGKKSLAGHLQIVQNSETRVEKIITFSDQTQSSHTSNVLSYDVFISRGLTTSRNNSLLRQREASVLPSDLLNMQFTSGSFLSTYPLEAINSFVGTTGSPKAAMLTHM